ncbi:LysR family transcriptional regulator [Acetobacter persici]|uniref:LysR family transcriptional regulator n=1 Tax=Acetobacter persici TaxID=1076596 RepID=UPI001BA8E24F|nr:LysR family transcriptional regulator [Acetobacter persici]MBS0964293.1 LysR family transcriptional regulator [Acetobacter persici]
MMDYLAAMKVFVRSAELGTFTRAAEEAGIKVSTVSRYITFLEDDLGAALFNRSTRHLHLTEMGRIFYEKAFSLLDDIEQIRSLVPTLNAIPQGLLRIQLPGAFARKYVVGVLGEFLAQHPMIQVETILADAERDIIEGGVDVALKIGALADSQLVARKIASNHYCCCVSPSFRDVNGRPDTPQALAHRPCLPLSLQSGATWAFRFAGGWEKIKVSGPLRSDDLECLRAAVIGGAGYAVLPHWLVNDDLQSGLLENVLADYEFSSEGEADEGIWITYPPKKIVPSKVRAFISFFENRYRAAIEW